MVHCPSGISARLSNIMLEEEINKFLEMDPVQFDQDENGWRSLVGKVTEEDIANLILKYIELNKNKIDEYNKDKDGEDFFPIDLLYFHSGQSFAITGTKYYKKAIECFKKSYYDENECWNAYVDGTIAFLEGDKVGVEKQIQIVVESQAKNKKGGNIGILKNFSRSLHQGIKDYEKVYNLPKNE